MFKTTRHTLRAGRDSRRSTLKQQRGGATLNYQGLCKWRDIGKTDAALSTDALSKWKPILTPTEFAFLLENRLPTPKEYITIVERQDDLFTLALQVIYKEIGVEVSNGEVDLTTVITKYGEYNTSSGKSIEPLKDYIRDIIWLVNLNKLETTTTSGRTSPSKTKLEKILTTTADAPFLYLLVNPTQIRNHFIYNLASTIVQFNTSKYLDDIKTVDSAIVAGYQLDSLAKANTLAASSMGLMDGPYMSFTTDNVDTMINTKNFWRTFLFRCQHKKPTDYSKDTGPLETQLADNQRGLADPIVGLYNTVAGNGSNIEKTMSLIPFISGMIYNKYKLASDINYIKKDIINTFILKQEKKDKQDANIFDTDHRASSLIDGNIVRFILHLIYTISVIEKPSSTPSATPSSSQGNKG